MSLVLLENATELGAVCNDGSPAGYFFRKGNPDKWIVHLMGGGWCVTEEACAQRMIQTPYLMTTKVYPSTFQFTGIFDQNTTTNPDFHDATYVYMVYCSSDSFSGTASLASNDTFGWHFQGKSIIKTAIQQLIPLGLGTSSEILLSGCSAGGAAVFANADYVASLLPPLEARSFKAHSDAGFFLDFPSMGQVPYTIPEILYYGSTLWMGVADEDCMAAFPSDGWKCYLGQYALPYVNTSVLVHQENEDRVQLNVLGVTYPLNSEMDAYLDTFRANMTATFMSTVLPPQHAVFSPACWFHCVLEAPQFWTISIDGSVSDQQALSLFYFDGITTDYIDECSGFNCSVGCPPVPPPEEHRAHMTLHQLFESS